MSEYHLIAKLAECGDELEQSMTEVKELADALTELVGIIDGGDKTDSFTTQPARRILKALEAKDE